MIGTKKQTKYVAFLRGINVGGNRIIKNTDLKECFEKMGLDDVVVVLQSGNVIFSSFEGDPSQLKSAIENSLCKRFNYPAKVIVKDLSSIRAIIEKYPFERRKSDEQHYVVFLSDDLAGEMIRSLKSDKQIEEAVAGDKLVYWKVTKGMTLKSEFGKLLSKAKYKEQNTVRNINTLQKLVR